jgi:hypothetical protein
MGQLNRYLKASIGSKAPYGYLCTEILVMEERIEILIHSSDAIREEIETELKAASLESRRLTLTTNSADAAQIAYHVLSVGIGASLTVVAKAIVAYMQKQKGQRKIIVQRTDRSGNLHRVEVETPRPEEIERLLQQARDVFIVEKEGNTEN